MKVSMPIEVVAVAKEKNSINFFEVDLVIFRGPKKLSDGTMSETKVEARGISREQLKPGRYLAEVNISAKGKGKETSNFSLTIVRVLEELDKQTAKK